MHERERLADLLAGLSMVCDLGFGLPLQSAMRGCALGTLIARRMGLEESMARDCFYAGLLMHIGCISMAHETTDVWGDDIRVTAAVMKVNVSKPLDMVGKLTKELGGESLWERTRFLGLTALKGPAFGKMFDTASCEVARATAQRLGLPDSTQDTVYQVAEWWKGGGAPRGLKGDDILLAARIVPAAEDAAFFDELGGVEAAQAALRHRIGLRDPQVVEVFCDNAAELLGELNARDPRDLLLELEPHPVVHVAPEQLPNVATIFGDAANLKTPYMHGNNGRMAALSERAAELLGLDESATDRLRLASRLHDVGRVGISDAVWEKPGPLTSAEWEQVRMHAYHSERIAAGSAALDGVARLIGMHHERLDGSGYHRGSAAREVAPEARLLAATDAFVGMTSARPHRPAHDPEAAAGLLTAEALAGKHDPDAVKAVIEAGGQASPRVRTTRPAGLTEREIDVLRLLANGHSNAEIGAALFISRRTAEHHVQSIYAKIGRSTRPGAALFAIEHDLFHAAP